MWDIAYGVCGMSGLFWHSIGVNLMIRNPVRMRLDGYIDGIVTLKMERPVDNQDC